MMTFLRGLIAAALIFAAPAALAQPAQWNYTAPNNVATATYPGDVTILGTCTGCGGGGVQLDVPNTWTALQTFDAGIAGTSADLETIALDSATALELTLSSIAEVATITAAAPAATTQYDVLTQTVEYYTTNAANNWTLNVRGSSGVTLNSLMTTGQAMTLALVTTQGGTAYYPTALNIDGAAVTPKWQGGTAPSAGNINGLDVYTYTIIKTAASTYTVLASQVQFK